MRETTRTKRAKARWAEWEKKIKEATKKAAAAIKEARAPKGATPAADDPVDQLARALALAADVCNPGMATALAAFAEAVGVAPQTVKTAVDKANAKRAEARSTKFPFAPGAVVRVTGNPNSHNYPKGKALLVFKDDRALRLVKGKWEIGNCLPADAALYAPADAADLDLIFEHLDSFGGFPD